MAGKRGEINDAEAAIIAEELRRGMPFAAAADRAGVSVGMVRRTLYRRRSLARELRMARGEGMAMWVERLRQAAEDGKVSAVTDAVRLFYPDLRESGLEELEDGMTVVFENPDLERL
jgi:hypothetical protein